MHPINVTRLLKGTPRVLSCNMHFSQKNSDVFGSDLRRQKSSRNRAPERVFRMLLVKLAVADRSAVAFDGASVFCNNNPFDEASVDFDLAAQVADVRINPQQSLNAALGDLTGTNKCGEGIGNAWIGWVEVHRVNRNEHVSDAHSFPIERDFVDLDYLWRRKLLSHGHPYSSWNLAMRAACLSCLSNSRNRS